MPKQTATQVLDSEIVSDLYASLKDKVVSMGIDNQIVNDFCDFWYGNLFYYLFLFRKKIIDTKLEQSR